MLEQTNLISAEDINAILADLDNKSTAAASSGDTASFSPFVAAAAVMAFYDPATIQPIDGFNYNRCTPDQLKNILIGHSEIVADSTSSDTGAKGFKSYKVLFTLKDEVRKSALKRLNAENKVHDAIKANAAAKKSNTALQYLLTGCLEGREMALSSMTFDELNALSRVVYWLEDLPGLVLPAKQDIIRQMELVEMLGPFKHLTGVYENSIFIEKFKGRKAELSTLRAYVGVASPKNLSEILSRTVEIVLSNEKKPLLIFGPGGVGKSTLLSKFLLEHAEANKSDRFPFVYLDFDRPNLSALDTETLVIEAARQLAIQYIDIEHIAFEFSNFHQRWNDSHNTLTGSSGTSQINLQSVESSKGKQHNRLVMRNEFVRLAKMLYGTEHKPFLIVLDTFEEVQFKGKEFVKEVMDFLAELRAEIPKLRAVIAGRSPIDKNTTTELELGDLDSEAAQAFLRANGVSATDAKKIVGRVSGNPLSLKLSIEIVKKYGIKELLSVDFSNGFFTFSRKAEIEVQGMLYNRILKHLHNNDVKKIAHPGLVLRKITPELILDVLAGPCKLNINTPEAAKEIFDELGREVSLVTKQGPDTLKHRADVRKVMLRLIMQSDKREQAMQIHQLAAAFYSKGNTLTDRAEEFYHQLAMGLSPRELEARWIDGIEDHLAGNIDELPDKAQAFLLGKAGREASNLDLWEKADNEDRLRHATKQAADLLNAGLAERALNLLNDVGISEQADAAITTIRVRALRQLNKYSEAADLSSRALKSFYIDDMPMAVLAELRKYANEDAPEQNWGVQPGGKIEGLIYGDPSGQLNNDENNWTESMEMPRDEYNNYERKAPDDDSQMDGGSDFTTFTA